MAFGVNSPEDEFIDAAVIPLHLDVTRAADWRAAVESCQREFGEVTTAALASISMNTYRPFA